jgi:hypothetical protein
MVNWYGVRKKAENRRLSIFSTLPGEHIRGGECAGGGLLYAGRCILGEMGTQLSSESQRKSVDESIAGRPSRVRAETSQEAVRKCRCQGVATW